jgi:hypothetical protein
LDVKGKMSRFRRAKAMDKTIVGTNKKWKWDGGRGKGEKPYCCEERME